MLEVQLDGPSSNGFQLLLNVCLVYGANHDTCNATMSLVLICRTRRPNIYSLLALNCLIITLGSKIKKYISDILSQNIWLIMIYRQCSQTSAQDNIPMRNCSMCIDEVKVSLFRALYCIPLYTAHL